MPQHVALIMDGNGRWALSKNLPTIAGHKSGAETIKHIAEKAAEMGVKILTLYTFSSENWGRDAAWIHDFMGLLKWYLKHEVSKLNEKNVQLQFIGDHTKFPDDIQTLIQNAITTTENNNGLTIVIALGYGGRDDIVRAVQTIAEKTKSGEMDPNTITESTITDHLDTRMWPNPDLLIRTGGDQRTSNYLLWQMAYTEFVFLDQLWPDFTPHDFETAINNYMTRERRYGRDH